ncbi:hypothetical protein, partial [Streptomyces sp. NPDC004658]|uniref:hypothetical protein n=1 Tax=Streptomyces sp. NPDC004658 TaxID=3154672 RepID=UPI0033B788D6
RREWLWHRVWELDRIHELPLPVLGQPPPKPTPRPSVTPVSYPAYHPHAISRPTRGHTSPVTYVLLITVPAIVAVAALRPR